MLASVTPTCKCALSAGSHSVRPLFGQRNNMDCTHCSSHNGTYANPFVDEWLQDCLYRCGPLKPVLHCWPRLARVGSLCLRIDAHSSRRCLAASILILQNTFQCVYQTCPQGPNGMYQAGVCIPRQTQRDEANRRERQPLGLPDTSGMLLIGCGKLGTGEGGRCRRCM